MGRGCFSLLFLFCLFAKVRSEKKKLECFSHERGGGACRNEEMNCTELDVALTEGQTFVTRTDEGFAFLVLAVCAASFLLAVFGERWARLLSAISATAVGLVGVYLLTGLVPDSGFSCEVRLAAAAVGGVLAGLLAWCLLKGGLFVLGGLGFGSVAHFVYESVPSLHAAHSATSPSLFGKPLTYYLLVGGVGLLGAVLSVAYRTPLLRVSTSLAGGGGVAVAVHLVASRVGHPAPSLLLVAVCLSVCLAGTAAQSYLAQKRGRRRRQIRRTGRRRRAGRRSREEEEEEEEEEQR